MKMKLEKQMTTYQSYRRLILGDISDLLCVVEENVHWNRKVEFLRFWNLRRQWTVHPWRLQYPTDKKIGQLDVLSDRMKKWRLWRKWRSVLCGCPYPRQVYGLQLQQNHMQQQSGDWILQVHFRRIQSRNGNLRRGHTPELNVSPGQQSPTEIKIK